MENKRAHDVDEEERSTRARTEEEAEAEEEAVEEAVEEYGAEMMSHIFVGEDEWFGGFTAEEAQAGIALLVADNDVQMDEQVVEAQDAQVVEAPVEDAQDEVVQDEDDEDEDDEEEEEEDDDDDDLITQAPMDDIWLTCPPDPTSDSKMFLSNVSLSYELLRPCTDNQCTFIPSHLSRLTMWYMHAITSRTVVLISHLENQPLNTQSLQFVQFFDRVSARRVEVETDCEEEEDEGLRSRVRYVRRILDGKTTSARVYVRYRADAFELAPKLINGRLVLTSPPYSTAII